MPLSCFVAICPQQLSLRQQPQSTNGKESEGSPLFKNISRLRPRSLLLYLLNRLNSPIQLFILLQARGVSWVLDFPPKSPLISDRAATRSERTDNVLYTRRRFDDRCPRPGRAPLLCHVFARFLGFSRFRPRAFGSIKSSIKWI